MGQTRINSQDIGDGQVRTGDLSILTTKGDLLTFGTSHIPISTGTSGQYLMVDASATAGIAWSALAVSGSPVEVQSRRGVAQGYAGLTAGAGYVPANQLGSGSAGAGSKLLADNNTWVFPAAVSHSALTNLDADDHTQYLLVDGTRAMAGNLQMGSFGITGARNIHASTGYFTGLLVGGNTVATLTGVESFSNKTINSPTVNNGILNGLRTAVSIQSGVSEYAVDTGSVLTIFTGTGTLLSATGETIFVTLPSPSLNSGQFIVLERSTTPTLSATQNNVQSGAYLITGNGIIGSNGSSTGQIYANAPVTMISDGSVYHMMSPYDISSYKFAGNGTSAAGWYFPGCINNGVAATTAAFTANTCYLLPMLLPKGGSIASIKMNVTTSIGGGGFSGAIYADGGNLRPGPLVYTLPALANASGVRTFSAPTAAAPLRLGPGLYWAAVVANTGSTVRAAAPSTMWGLLGLSDTLGASINGLGYSIPFTVSGAGANSTWPTLLAGVFTMRTTATPGFYFSLGS